MARSRNDRSIKPLIASVVLGAQLASMLPAPAAADDGAIAPAVAPNVVIVLDSSSRMADNAPTTPYVVTKRYPVQRRCLSASRTKKSAATQPCAAAAVFKGSSYVHFADSPAALSSREAEMAKRALVDAGYWVGALRGANVTLYTGNYVNYLFASCASGGACPQSRLTNAKRALSAVLDTHRGVRLGIMTPHHGPHGVRGGRMVATVGSAVPAMKSALMAIVPGRDAALGDALYDAGRYFKGEPLNDGTNFPSPIQLACQANHIIVISDGAGIETSGARSLSVEAALRKEQDHSTVLPDVQRVTVHTIAFGVGTSSSAPDGRSTALEAAAENGGGSYLHAETVGELEAALRVALGRITQATYSFTNPVLSGFATAGDRRAYLAAFEQGASTPVWRGSLRAYRRDATGVLPSDTDGMPAASALIWDAGRGLNGLASGRRTIYTEVAGALTPFTKANRAITSGMLGVASTAERSRVIDFVRGVDVNDERRARDRSWKLGAIVHSTPVLVTAPVLALNDPSYQAFKAAQAKRTRVLIVGADDGMLHAFRDSDGMELWAFIPPDVLPHLAALTAVDGGHRSFVDGSPVAVDIKLAGTWRTIVIFGCRAGGAAYYALDITETTSPKFLWRFTDPKIRATWSEPAIGKTRIAGLDAYVAFVGGGQSPSGDELYGNAFFAIDVATGTKVWEYAGMPGRGDDRRHMTFAIPANPTAVDVDNDGYVDHVYIGDVGGQLWKFDVSAVEPSAWKGKRFFAPPTRGDVSSHAIHTAPAVALDRQRALWVFFAAGRSNDPSATWSSRFYALKDDADMTNGTALSAQDARIKDVTSTNVAAPRGWYIVLGQTEAIFAPPNVFNEIVFFTSFTPDHDGVCAPGAGNARLYALHAWSGQAAIDFATGTARPSMAASASRFKPLGRGVPATPIVVTMPPVVPGTPVVSSVVTATSNQQLSSTTIPAPPFLKQVKSWRERMP